MSSLALTRGQLPLRRGHPRLVEEHLKRFVHVEFLDARQVRKAVNLPMQVVQVFHAAAGHEVLSSSQDHTHPVHLATFEGGEELDQEVHARAPETETSRLLISRGY